MWVPWPPDRGPEFLICWCRPAACSAASSYFKLSGPRRLVGRTWIISKVGSAYILPICKIWTLHYSTYCFWSLHIILHIVRYICRIICTICKMICRKIVQCSDSAYFAYCNMHNMQNISNNMLQYAKQYAKYGKEYAEK